MPKCNSPGCQMNREDSTTIRVIAIWTSAIERFSPEVAGGGGSWIFNTLSPRFSSNHNWTSPFFTTTSWHIHPSKASPIVSGDREFRWQTADRTSTRHCLESTRTLTVAKPHQPSATDEQPRSRHLVALSTYTINQVLATATPSAAQRRR
jgi:hypothetical protein